MIILKAVLIGLSWAIAVYLICVFFGITKDD